MRTKSKVPKWIEVAPQKLTSQQFVFILCFSSKKNFTKASFPRATPRSLGDLPASKAQPRALATEDDLPSLDLRAGLVWELGGWERKWLYKDF